MSSLPLTLELENDAAQKTKSPRRFKVVLHNDDHTTTDFVVDILIKFFHKNETEAAHIMWTVHKKGKGVAGIFPHDIAETKVCEVTQYARDHDMPLLLTTEPE